ncbi:NAD(P)-binding protein [Myriangium duriaei CBS 260.36]|uniref:NAD(P)-binding protein n=1 Tax=Myriangium duriaei CBS 260.36 TaxID=1168546 RepID=A0A9P4MH38_9PEZI|nr:NAD(P)-binding protein [Myriangium duriaei CBS 260.36]
MSSSARPAAIIVGVGPFISRSLSIYLTQQGYNLGLISRSQSGLDKLASELKSKHNATKVVTHSADAGDAASLSKALDSVNEQLGRNVDALIYNAARVGPNDLLELTPDILEQDFKTAAVGTLVAGQWFSKHANTKHHPLLIITGGTLDREPNADYSSLSAAKAASQSISVMFSKVLPEKHGIRVGTPLIVEPIIPDGDKGGFVTKSDPAVIVEKIFKPFFDDRAKDLKDWIVERIW